MTSVKSCTWPYSRLPEGLLALVDFSNLGNVSQDSLPSFGIDDPLEEWMAAAAPKLDVDLQAVELSFGSLINDLPKSAPALLALPEGCLLVLAASGRVLTVVDPGLRRKCLIINEVVEALLSEAAASIDPLIDRILSAVGNDGSARQRAKSALQGKLLDDSPGIQGWLITMPPARPFSHQIRNAGVYQRLGGLAVLFGVQNIFMIL